MNACSVLLAFGIFGLLLTSSEWVPQVLFFLIDLPGAIRRIASSSEK